MRAKTGVESRHTTVRRDRHMAFTQIGPGNPRASKPGALPSSALSSVVIQESLSDTFFSSARLLDEVIELRATLPSVRHQRTQATLSAKEWEDCHLAPQHMAIPLEANFEGQRLFYGLGQHLSSGASSVCFSNELPGSLISEKIHADAVRRQKEITETLNSPNLGGIKKIQLLNDLRKSESEISLIRTPLNITNAALVIRNALLLPSEIWYMHSTKHDTPNFPRWKSLLKIPNVLVFNTLLHPESAELSALGARFKELVPGKTFLDLACGDRTRSVGHRAIAQQFGAYDYVGVDHECVKGFQKTWCGEFPGLSGTSDFTSRYFKGDILTFLRRLREPGPLFVRVEGLEACQNDLDEAGNLAYSYLQKVLAELRRVMKPGDVLSVGRVVSFIKPQSSSESELSYGSPCLAPEDYGFRFLEGSENRECLWVRE